MTPPPLKPTIRAWLACAIVMTAAVALAAAPAQGSQIEPDSAGFGPSGADQTIALTGERLPARGDWSLFMWVWPEKRLGFQVVGNNTNNFEVTSWDLDTLQQVASLRLPNTQLASNSGSTTVVRTRMASGTLDPQTGRLFLGVLTQGQGVHEYTSLGVDTRSAGTCLLLATGACSTLLVLQAETLEPVDYLPLNANGQGALAPVLQSITYSPPRGPSDRGKIHALVYDYAANNTQRYANMAYAVQIDADTLKQDWAVRLDGCRDYAREIIFGANDWADVSDSRNRTTVFRSPSVTDPAVWVMCYIGGQTAVVVRVPLDASGAPYAGVAGTPASITPPEPAAASAGPPTAEELRGTVSTAGSQEVFVGPRAVTDVVPDPASDRMLLRAVDGRPHKAEVWWVFDGRTRSFAGTIGIGLADLNDNTYGFDPTTGRLYVLGKRGLFAVDARRSPVPQALHFPQYIELVAQNQNTDANGAVIAVLPAVEHSATRLFIRLGYVNAGGATGSPLRPTWLVAEDRVPVSVDAAQDDFAGRTLDLDELQGATQSAFDGAARGYGVRALFVDGVDKVARGGPLDVSSSIGYLELNNSAQLILRNPCRQTTREVVVASVGPDEPSVVDNSGARGSADPLILDSGTMGDLEAPVSRCGLGFTPHDTDNNARKLLGRGSRGGDWESWWNEAKIMKPPVGEPAAPWVPGSTRIDCASGEEPSASYGDPVSSAMAAGLSCDPAEAGGHSYVRGMKVGDVGVSEALTSFRIYRDPGRGIVSRVSSVVRGLNVAGAFRIDLLRGSAESWANGRAQPVGEVERDAGYDPNCDVERSAGTCFQRAVFGLVTPAYRCGPCGDEKAAADAMTKALGSNGRVQFREPDPKLRKGAANGFIAAITKRQVERFSDLALNQDLLQTVVPSLEIVRYTPASTSVDTSNNYAEGGRQIYQFAGVEVSSSYSIQCLLVYDPEANTCAAPSEPPGSITVSLSDPDGKPLAGGAFEIRNDADSDDVVGLADTLLPEGACVTTEDGTGTCTFENLAPGAYLVSQVAAPPGYGKVAEPFVVNLASGEARTVTFTNTSNVSTVQLTVTDEADRPLSGAVFAAYPDPDSDGKIAADAQPAATCTTAADGTCNMQVPAGSYVLVQTSAPDGLEPIEPVAFTFATGGQTAAVGIVNYPPGTPAAPAAPAGPASVAVDYTPAPDLQPVTETISPTDNLAVSDASPTDEPAISVPDAIGGTVVRVIQAPGDALQLLSREPREAIAWTATLLLVLMAAGAIRRRQHALTLLHQPLALNNRAPTLRGSAPDAASSAVTAARPNQPR